jgi:hypothetical protein
MIHRYNLIIHLYSIYLYSLVATSSILLNDYGTSGM